MRTIIPNTNKMYSCDVNGNIYREETIQIQTRKLRNGQIRDIRIKFPFRKINPYKSKNGYYVMTLFNKTFYYHDLIALTFLGEKPKMMTVNHKNGIKTDNRIENLEYLSYRDNNLHAVFNNLNKIKISDYTKRVAVIALKNGLEIKRFNSAKEAEQELNVFHVTCICKGKRKSSKGYTFRYA